MKTKPFHVVLSVNGVKHYSLLLVILLAPVASGQDVSIRVGETEFFGSAGVDPNKVRVPSVSRRRDDRQH